MESEAPDTSKQSYFAPQSSPLRPSQHVEGDTAITPHTPITEQPPPLPVVAPPPSSTTRARGSTNPVQNVNFRPLDRQQSAIRLRRLRTLERPGAAGQGDGALTGRRRSTSEPQQPGQYPESAVDATVLSSVPETTHPTPQNADDSSPHQVVVPVDNGRGGFHRILGRRRKAVVRKPRNAASEDDCYDSRIVDVLDVIDPEVATLSSITNVQNSLFVPSLGRWVNRRPTYDLSQLQPIPGAFPESAEDVTSGGDAEAGRPPTVRAAPSMSSVLTDTQYAILPDDATLEGWKEEDIKLLNDYVRHMLHSRRSKIKQRLKAFAQYTRRPLGFLVTLYATLITLFGLAWVLFLIGWIYVGEKQLYAIDVIDIVLVVLFNIVGVGFAPFRAIDTYHMAYVSHYHRKTWKMRKKLLLPKLKDHNDLPTAERTAASESSDLEAGRQGHPDTYFPVLSEKEQATLLHHQNKLAKSHTFYKPHETETHHAFPLRLLVAVVLLLDLHSCLQITLGACTYGTPYPSRSAAVTTTVLCCSIATNATAGILISIGDRRTRKKDVLERIMKQELTAEVMGKIKKQKEKEEKEAQKEENKEDTGLLGLSMPLVEKIRRSTDNGSSSGNRKEER